MPNKHLLDTGMAKLLVQEDAAILRRVAAAEGMGNHTSPG
jgi:hypothetical protein